MENQFANGKMSLDKIENLGTKQNNSELVGGQSVTCPELANIDTVNKLEDAKSLLNLNDQNQTRVATGQEAKVMQMTDGQFSPKSNLVNTLNKLNSLNTSPANDNGLNVNMSAISHNNDRKLEQPTEHIKETNQLNSKLVNIEVANGFVANEIITSKSDHTNTKNLNVNNVNSLLNSKISNEQQPSNTENISPTTPLLKPDQEFTASNTDSEIDLPKRIHVSNVPFKYDDKALRALFAVSDIKLLKNLDCLNFKLFFYNLHDY